MSKKSKISVIGGDARLFYMVKELVEMNYDVCVYRVTDGMGIDTLETLSSVTICNSLQEAMDFSDVIVGPVPFSKTQVSITSAEKTPDLSIKHFLSCITSSHTLFGGAIPKSVKQHCDKNFIRYVDFMDIDEVAILNAVSTAEGTIAEAIMRSTVNLNGAYCLVLGYGKCGSVLAHKLKGLDAKVCVSARRNTVLAEAKCAGFETLPFHSLKNSLSEFLFIFNTIPAQYFNESLLKEVSKDATFIDISSSPGCVDLDAASRLGVKTALCLGLPGKYAPKTSAAILVEALVANLKPQS